MKRKIQLIFSLLFLAVSLPLLVWGFWPPRRETIVLPLLPAPGMLSLPEARTIHLKFSPVMRAGDSQIVELNLSADGVATDTSLYEQYRVIAEARLDLPFADVRPADIVSTALGEGGAATFYWDVNPREEGELRGTVWLYPVDRDPLKVHAGADGKSGAGAGRGWVVTWIGSASLKTCATENT
jgi:hypothetical protein